MEKKAYTHTPEIDTIRIQWHCGKMFDLDAFFNGVGSKMIRIVERNPKTKEIINDWDKIRADQRKSWYGKMQIIDDIYTWGLHGERGKRTLSFEFSLAKWFNYSNGLNLGIAPAISNALGAISDALRSCQALRFTKFKSYDAMFAHLSKHCLIRRLDLSLNFKVPPKWTVDEWIELLGRVVINQQRSESVGAKSTGLSRVWASPRSPYRITFYNKEAEQKHYFHTADFSIRPEDRKSKLMFYEQIKPQLKNVLRFEMQFRNSWFRDLTKPTKEFIFNRGKPVKFSTEKDRLRWHVMKNGIMGETNIQNVIDYSVIKWRETLDAIRQQLDRKNFDCGNSERIQENSGAEYVLGQIKKDIDEGRISRTVGDGMQMFLLNCYKYGSDSIRKSMRKETFYQKRKKLISFYEYDVKIELPGEFKVRADCPIMPITETLFQSKQYNDLKFINFIPATDFDASEVYNFCQAL